MAANTFGYAGFIAVAAVAALLASEMTGNDSIAGIPSAAATLGTAFAAAPLAQRSKRYGRRIGLRLGYLIGVIGCAVAFIAGQLDLFWLLVVAMAAMGVGNTSNLQIRFVAADLADEDKRARSIALVVWVGTVGAVIGSPVAAWANRVGTKFGIHEWVAPTRSRSPVGSIRKLPATTRSTAPCAPCASFGQTCRHAWRSWPWPSAKWRWLP